MDRGASEAAAGLDKVRCLEASTTTMTVLGRKMGLYEILRLVFRILGLGAITNPRGATRDLVYYYYCNFY